MNQFLAVLVLVFSATIALAQVDTEVCKGTLNGTAVSAVVYVNPDNSVRYDLSSAGKSEGIANGTAVSVLNKESIAKNLDLKDFLRANGINPEKVDSIKVIGLGANVDTHMSLMKISVKNKTVRLLQINTIAMLCE